MSVSEREVREFMSLHRIAVVGASDDPKKFGNTVYKEMKAQGYDVVPVNVNAPTVDGDPAYRDLASIPAPVEGVIVMVAAAKAAAVVKDAIDAGVRSIWLFKGAGTGAVSHEAIELCRDHDVTLVAGACPLMFFEDTQWIHKVHRTFRRLGGTLKKAA